MSSRKWTHVSDALLSQQTLLIMFNNYFGQPPGPSPLPPPGGPGPGFHFGPPPQAASVAQWNFFGGRRLPFAPRIPPPQPPLLPPVPPQQPSQLQQQQQYLVVNDVRYKILQSQPNRHPAASLPAPGPPPVRGTI